MIIMKGKLLLKISIGIVVLAVVILLISPVIVEPLVHRKVQLALNERFKDYIFKIDKVHISLLSSTIEFEKISIASKREPRGNKDLNGEIASVKFKGIKLLKAMFKKDFDIDEVIISNYSMKGKIPFPKKATPPTVSHLNIRIGKVLVDKINLALEDSSTAKSFSVKEGILKVYNIQIEKQDTLNGFLRQFDFEAEEFLSVSSDSMYTFKTSGITYSDSLKTLSVNGLSIHPNYKDYDFTARHKYETDRVEAELSNVFLYDFTPEDYFKSGNLISSYIEIGKMEMNVFRDKRKEDSHMKKPSFQDMIYNYPGTLHIDSVGLKSGNITYTEHAEKANEPGMISLNELNAKIYNITNDTIYKTESASMEMKAKALLMGKGRLSIALKAKLFDNQNTFSMNGILSDLEVKELNPMLEKNAFIYATSGKITKMDFSFTANNTKATGQMTMLYNGLELAVKNKRTDDTTAIKERIVSIIANKKALNSNPLPGEEVRMGTIHYERDPEKFLINYCFQSILSGIKSSVIKNQKEKKEKKTLIQKIFGKRDDK